MKPKHGMSQDIEYTLWENVVARCTNPKTPHFDRYGGRGITIHEPWRASFECFFSYVGRRPEWAHSLDRIDNNKGYEPGNVRWATRTQQQRNMVRNVLVDFNGASRTISEWAELTGIPKGVIGYRLKRGWPAEKALTEPVRKTQRKRQLNGRSISIAKVCAELGISRAMVHLRLGRGWTFEDAIRIPAKNQPSILHNGKLWTAGQLASHYGIVEATLRLKMRNGLSAQKAIESIASSPRTKHPPTRTLPAIVDPKAEEGCEVTLWA